MPLINAKLMDDLRIAKGLLSRELAARVETSANTLCRIRAGKPVSLVTARNVAKVLGIPLPELLRSGPSDVEADGGREVAGAAA
ncbi:MAG: helix-turn-helix domain-containing protein [Phycisphaerae bacterium]